jgi:hypothetical protein
MLSSKASGTDLPALWSLSASTTQCLGPKRPRLGEQEQPEATTSTVLYRTVQYAWL